MKFQWQRFSVVALAVLTVVGCSEAPTHPEVPGEQTVDPLLMKGGNGGGGGGKPGGGSNDPVHSLSFVNPADPTDLSIRLFGDGTGPFSDGVSVARQFVFDPEGGTPICLRFSGAAIPADLADDLDGTGKVCTDGDLRTVWHSNDDAGLDAMAPGETIPAEARYIWEDGENNQFKLEFFCRDDRGNDGGGTACPNLLDVTMVSEVGSTRTWNLTFDPTLDAMLSRNFVKGKPRPFEVLATFNMPFDMTVTRTD